MSTLDAPARSGAALAAETGTPAANAASAKMCATAEPPNSIERSLFMVVVTSSIGKFFAIFIRGGSANWNASIIP
jgi:hypothetical protein